MSNSPPRSYVLHPKRSLYDAMLSNGGTGPLKDSYHEDASTLPFRLHPTSPALPAGRILLIKIGNTDVYWLHVEGPNGTRFEFEARPHRREA